MPEKYYFGYNKIIGLLETCKVERNKSFRAMIGSAACCNCEYNRGYNADEEWIKCKELNKALGREE